MTTTADRLKERGCKAMRELALHPARGWDSEQDRLPVLIALDALMEEWLCITCAGCHAALVHDPACLHGYQVYEAEQHRHVEE